MCYFINVTIAATKFWMNSVLTLTYLPVIFCKKSRGIFRWQHSCMKCAPLRADSENKTPLFPMIPTGYPWIRAKPLQQKKKHKKTIRKLTSSYLSRIFHTCPWTSCLLILGMLLLILNCEFKLKISRAPCSQFQLLSK